MNWTHRVAAHAALAAALWASHGAAHADLHSRGDGMVYDDALNVTWLADWNYAQTSGYDADGLMTWDEANTWAQGLVHGGFDDWRLPSTLDGVGACGAAFGCTDSELGRMFYDSWGATAESYFSTGSHPESIGLFSNVQLYFYWSGTPFAEDLDTAWRFDTRYGYQGNYYKNHYMFAVAVRNGDAAAALTVPEPQTWPMMLLGLGGLGVMSRAARRQRGHAAGSQPIDAA